MMLFCWYKICFRSLFLTSNKLFKFKELTSRTITDCRTWSGPIQYHCFSSSQPSFQALHFAVQESLPKTWDRNQYSVLNENLMRPPVLLQPSQNCKCSFELFNKFFLAEFRSQLREHRVLIAWSISLLTTKSRNSISLEQLLKVTAKVVLFSRTYARHRGKNRSHSPPFERAPVLLQPSENCKRSFELFSNLFLSSSAALPIA